MSREAFEKWYAGYFGCEFGLNYHGDDDLERAWQAATEAAQKEWTPYKKGDDVAYDTNALVTYEFLPLGCNEYGVTEAWFRSDGWETIDDEIIDNVTAYRPLPAPYGGE